MFINKREQLYQREQIIKSDVTSKLKNQKEFYVHLYTYINLDRLQCATCAGQRTPLELQ